MKILSIAILALGMMSANFSFASCGCKHGEKDHKACNHKDGKGECGCAGKEGKEHTCEHKDGEHAGHTEKKEEKK